MSSGKGVGISNAAELRAMLREAGFRPSRRHGQNFLVDVNLARAIARDAGVPPGGRVLEIGPGPGMLTVQLLAGGARVLAVEIDPRLAQIAQSHAQGVLGAPGLEPPVEAARGASLELLVMDALDGPRRLAPALCAKLSEGDDDWRVVSNLPYSISGPVLALLAERDAPPLSVTALVQLELGQRLAAEPGSRDFGPLTVAVQQAYQARLVRRVPPTVFWPEPKVESTVVRLDLRPDLDPAPLRAARLELARALLERRRQTVQRVLGERLGDRAAAGAALERAGIEGSRRPGTLGLGDWAALEAALRGV